MKVDVTHSEKRGGFFSGKGGYVVSVKISLSAEEENAVNARNLWKWVVFTRKNLSWDTASEKERQISLPEYSYDVRRVCKGVEIVFDTPSEAKEFADSLREKFQNLKHFIVANQTTGKNQTFEL